MLDGVAPARREEGGHPSDGLRIVDHLFLIFPRQAVEVASEVVVAAEGRKGDTARVFAHHRLHAWQSEDRHVFRNAHIAPYFRTPDGAASLVHKREHVGARAHQTERREVKLTPGALTVLLQAPP